MNELLHPQSLGPMGSACRDVVFDIQECLLRAMRGAQADDDALLDMAS
jgi:hypothetical protein